jgi:dsRNA-specific ribonuclease
VQRGESRAQRTVKRRYSQDVEWIGDAALVMLLRQIMVNLYPNVSFSCLTHVILKLCCNERLQNYGKAKLDMNRADGNRTT